MIQIPPDSPWAFPNHAKLCLDPFEVAVVRGAIDSLAVALTDHHHTWTVGERTIYEEAMVILNRKPEAQAGP